MKVGLCHVDGRWANVALMRLSAYHKARGDDVSWFLPLLAPTYDVVYASKIFNFTPDNPDLNLANNIVVKGGSDYDLHVKLDPDIEKMRPDYSIYPQWPAAIGYTTRGCIRNCPFCIVREKEGPLSVVGNVSDFYDGQNLVILLDNNLTAAPIEHFRNVADEVNNFGAKIDYSQGLDARLLTEEHANILSTVKLANTVKLAFDSIRVEPHIRRAVSLLDKAGINPKRVVVYVLIGYDTTFEEDWYRVKTLRELNTWPYIMPYDKSQPYQRTFADWVNVRWNFEAIPWMDFVRKHNPKLDLSQYTPPRNLRGREMSLTPVKRATHRLSKPRRKRWLTTLKTRSDEVSVEV